MIIYYSGTGNSLQVAKQLAEKTSDSYVSIFNVDEKQLSDEKRIGFVFPVYNHGIPPFVRDAILKLQLPNNAYVYLVSCHGGDIGNTSFQFNELMKVKNVNLSYVADVKMPVNSRIMYRRVTDQIEKRIEATKIKLDVIAAQINSNTKNVSKFSEKRILTWITNWVTSDSMRKRFTPVVDPEICINCGICVKVCPVQNIKIQNDKAVIGDECEQCVTCMHWCPQTAIHFSKTKVKSQQQYHHPKVKWTDIKVR